MTDKQTEALKLALEALEGLKALPGGRHQLHEINMIHRKHDLAIATIREALALVNEVDQERPAQQQEPVLFNGLTEAETNATASVMGLTKKAKQEPVAWRSWNDHDGYGFWETKQEAEPWCAPDFFAEPLYTSPPIEATARASKPWVGLTEKEKREARNSVSYSPLAMTMGEWIEAVQDATEAKLREKNT